MSKGPSEFRAVTGGFGRGQAKMLDDETDPGAEGADTNLTQESADLIGRQLRKVYSDLVAEPLPDRFADLLSRLSATDKS